MKKKYTLLSLISSFILCALNQSFAITDTLRHYNTTIGSKGYAYPMTTYPKQYARFETKAPCSITKVIITLNGAAGSCKMHIFGHEGGGPYPALQQDLITPVTVNKSVSGLQKVAVTLPTPLFIDNNQFFIKLENFTTNVMLVTDTITHLSCSSLYGGDMWYQFLQDASGTPYSGNSAFSIDVVMDCPSGITSPQLFQNISTSSTIGTSLSNATISWSDIDNDGYLDLLASGKLFKNNQNNTFSDISVAAGINTPFYRNVFIDMNNDGKDDILFLSNVKANNVLYINNGNSTFTKYPINLITPDFDNISTISIADINFDKYPDLFVGQLRDINDVAEPNYFYLNDKNLGFVDTTSVFYPSGSIARQTRGSMFADFDNDGDLDLYVSNYRNAPDELWRNNGNGTFTDIAASKSLDINLVGGTSNHGSGCDWTDYDNDGYMDLLLPNLCHPANLVSGYSPTLFYKNSGPPNYNFINTSSSAKIQYEETHAGATWGDINSDGLEDLFFSSFYSCRYSDVYLQQPDHSFQMKTWEYGIQKVAGETDGTLVDFNNDGKLDLACGDNSYYFRLYKNGSASGNNYISIDLTSTSGNTMAIGAKVIVYAGGKTYTKYQMPNHGALMNKSNRLFFGLGTDIPEKVLVSWPNGTINYEQFTNITINSINSLTEGTGVVVTSVEGALANNSLYIHLYPNPVENQFVVRSSDLLVRTIDIYNIIGKKIHSIEYSQGTNSINNLMPNTNAEIAVDISMLTSGIYFVQVTGLGSSTNEKIIFNNKIIKQ